MDTVALKKSLEQGSAKHNLLAKSGPLTISDTKFLEHSHTHRFMHWLQLFLCDRKELSNCEKGCISLKS